jgi:transcription initiation factor IIF auxiliary subunit
LTKAIAGVLIASFSDKPSEMEGFPMKTWNIEIYLLDEAGHEKPANCFTKAVYNLHPSFANPVQSECATSGCEEDC